MTTSVAQCTFCGCRAPEAADDLSASPRCFGCGRSLQSGGGGDAVLDSLPSSTTFDTRCEIFTVADLNMTLKRIPPGRFVRGSDTGLRDAGPHHEVTLTQVCWMANRPVSQAIYHQVMGYNPSTAKGDLLPVETVSWHHAMEFCYQLTARARKAEILPWTAAFRLPTEAEWEWAACGPATEGALPRATPPAKKGMVLCAESGRMGPDAAPRPAGPHGLYDLCGTIGEWCLDWFAPYTEGPARDPRGPGTGTLKVRRGGSWAAVWPRCHPTDRIGLPPNTRSPRLGFRPVVSLIC